MHGCATLPFLVTLPPFTRVLPFMAQVLPLMVTVLLVMAARAGFFGHGMMGREGCTWRWSRAYMLGWGALSAALRDHMPTKCEIE